MIAVCNISLFLLICGCLQVLTIFTQPNGLGLIFYICVHHHEDIGNLFGGEADAE